MNILPATPAAPEGSWSQPQQSLFPPSDIPQPAPQPADPDPSVFYLCQFQMGGTCGRLVHGDRNSLRAHLIKRHGVNMADTVTMIPCTWGNCPQEMRAGNIPRHALGPHLDFRWCCSHCGFQLPRDDAMTRHRNKSKHEQCRTATVHVIPGIGGTWL
ncbi:hypothetical protein BV22DRAFT_787239 [Leucogyrophana mollusca]|uniref:Uncharacterized protein n=1 Tax=Leucogyrophana mollusca TaxID=85980 RepID=A0ACB8B6X5_9AGAM|nr:hypothetical protein BV22DRAFT_787239 [Leucogyrophana mollusca]